MTAALYGGFTLAAVKGEFDLDTDTVKALLVDATYVFNPDTHDYLDDITGEIVGTGYTAGGVPLTNFTFTKDTANNKITFDADDVSFGTVTITGAAGIVLYVSKGTAAASPLMCYEALSPAVDVSGAAFTYVFPAAGIGSLSY